MGRFDKLTQLEEPKKLTPQPEVPPPSPATLPPKPATLPQEAKKPTKPFTNDAVP